MRTQTTFEVAQPDSTTVSPPSRYTTMGSASPPLKVARGGLLGWAYLVVLMTPVLWILLFVVADIVGSEGRAQPLGFLMTGAILLAFSVPTVAVVVLAMKARRQEQPWLAFPLTLAFGLQVWAATEVQTPVLLLITMGVALAAAAGLKRMEPPIGAGQH